MTPSPSGYELRSVVHLVRPTGTRACTLDQLRTGIQEAHERSLFFHARHHQLRHPASEEPAVDDFSAWVNGVLQDRETAERISFAVQNHAESPEGLRNGLVEALTRVPDSGRLSRAIQSESEFVFLLAESVPLQTGVVATSARELVHALVAADASVWFYHLIEQPWFPEGITLDQWLVAREETEMADWLREGALAGRPIEAMRRRLLQRWRRSRIGRRVSEAATAPEDTRREAGRATVARLVRRITKTDPPA
jgi:hypothetical protein